MMEVFEVGVRVEIYRMGPHESKDPKQNIFQAMFWQTEGSRKSIYPGEICVSLAWMVQRCLMT